MRSRLKIQNAVIKDAIKVCGSICRMNATSAVGYAFTCADDGKSVDVGEFIYAGELIDDNYDGYIDFKTSTISNLKNGVKRKIIERNK